jgi:hypothetical protein
MIKESEVIQKLQLEDESEVVAESTQTQPSESVNNKPTAATESPDKSLTKSSDSLLARSPDKSLEKPTSEAELPKVYNIYSPSV